MNFNFSMFFPSKMAGGKPKKRKNRKNRKKKSTAVPVQEVLVFYEDPFFLQMVAWQARIVKNINYAQNLTAAASYRVGVGLAALVILLLLVIQSVTFGGTQCYSDVMSQEKIFDDIKKSNLTDIFFYDKKVFIDRSDNYISYHYGELISIVKNLKKLSIEHDSMKTLSKTTANIGILVAILPLAFNAPWTTNILFICGSTITRFTVDYSTPLVVITTYWINIFVALGLIGFHAGNLVVQYVMQHTRRR